MHDYITILFWMFWSYSSYRWLFEFRLIGQNPKPLLCDYPMVSIVIACRNELHLLQQHISAFGSQDYPDYELILVDDQSDIPITFERLGKSIQSEKIKIFRTVEPFIGKKNAIRKGIENAQGSWIALSDADCCPISKAWISSMMTNTQNKDVIVGYSPYKSYKGLLNQFIQYETLYVAIQYISAIQQERAYGAVGRNLYFRKSLFYRLEGYNKHMQILSGIDDLFIRDAYENGARIGFATDSKSIVMSEPNRTWKGLFRQKLRHVSSSFYYKSDHKMRLILAHVSHIGLYVCLILLLGFSPHWSVFAGILFYWTILYVRVLKWANMLHSKSQKHYIPVLDLTLALYYVTIAIFAKAGVDKW